MRIATVKHKGLRRLLDADDASGLPPAFVGKIRNILAFLQDMESVEELRTIPSWNAHPLTGNRKGSWSLVVSRNWRITFAVNETDAEIMDLDYEDYH